MEHNNDFKYDLMIGQEGESIMARLLADTTVEVKTDWIAARTGNVYIEYESRGKPSGLAKTQAKFWAYIILKEDTPRESFDVEAIQDILFFKVEKIKDVCRNWLKTNPPKKGGDSNTSLGCLIPIKDLY